MRDVIIAGKDVEVDDARKLLKDTKDKQKQLGSVSFHSFSNPPLRSTKKIILTISTLSFLK